MAELIKIREVSSKYDISARALRYYEDAGLIKSTRSSDYAYRLYDEQAIKRLEQILILRKLNISIKDIQLIFQSSSSEIVLEVLRKKVESIDDKVTLLQDLKGIILDFIGQIKQADFSREADVKRLYEKAAKMESLIENISYDGNPSQIKGPAAGNGVFDSRGIRQDPADASVRDFGSLPAGINRLLDVTDKLKSAPEVRIIQINPFKAFSSGADSVENVMGAFQQWQEAHNHLVKKMIYGAPDFLWFEEDMKAVWIWAVEEWVTEEDTVPYELVDFEGGLYAAAMSVDGDGDIGGRVCSGILKWLEGSGFEPDERPGHRTMCHMVNPTDEIRNALGYDQLDIYVPIKIRGREQ